MLLLIIKVVDFMAEAKSKIKSKTAFRPIYAVAIVVVAAVVIGLMYVTTGSAAQTVAVGDNISVYYTGTFTNGTVFDTNVGKQPLNFTVGAGQLIQGFDQGVVGMKLNQNKTITLPANEAYGPVNPSLIITVSRKMFGNQSIQIGEVVTNSQGQQGRITMANATNVTVNLNSPLAGQTLVFQIKVVAIHKKA